MDLKGFEYIDRTYKNQPAILYFRFLNDIELCVKQQDFIDKASGKYTKKELEERFEIEYNKIPETIETKTADYKKKLKTYLRDKIVAENKMKNGIEKYKKLIVKIKLFAEELLKEV